MTDIYANGDFLRMQALLTRYVWALDMADIKALMQLFTEDGVFQDTAGNIYAGHQAMRGYFQSLMDSTAFRGRQHHIDNLRIEAEPGGYAARSYWTVTKWDSARNEKRFEVIGHSVDRFVKGPEGFLLRERRVMYWRDADCPWHPDGTAV